MNNRRNPEHTRIYVCRYGFQVSVAKGDVVA